MVQWKAGLFRSNIRVLHLTNRTNRSIGYGPFSNGVYLTVLDNPRNLMKGVWFVVPSSDDKITVRSRSKRKLVKIYCIPNFLRSH